MLTKLVFVKAWRRKIPGSTVEIESGVADLLVRRKVAEYVGNPAETIERGADNSSDLGTVDTRPSQGSVKHRNKQQRP